MMAQARGPTTYRMSSTASITISGDHPSVIGVISDGMLSYFTDFSNGHFSGNFGPPRPDPWAGTPAAADPFNRYPASSTDGSAESSSSPGVESSSGEVVELPVKADIIKAMECQVCQEVCVPPIWNCESGHIACNSCRPRLENCALCKKDFTGSRNYPLEAISLSSKFYCQYKPEGCPDILAGDKYSEHTLNCIYRHLRKVPESRPSNPSSPGSHQGTWEDSSDSGESSDGWADSSPPNSARHPEYMLSIFNRQFVSDSDSEIEAAPVTPAYRTTDWIRCTHGDIPPNAVVGGETLSGEALYVIRAYEGNTLVAGQLCCSDRAAFIIFNGRLRRKWYYEVLVSVPGVLEWVNFAGPGYFNHCTYPLDAVRPSARSDYRVGRIYIGGRYICGVISPVQGEPHRCYVKDRNARGGLTFATRDYQLLVFRRD